MAINNFDIKDILERVFITLPTKFSREEGTNLSALLSGISAALKINTDSIDELFRQTYLVSSSGEYVDEYIVDLSEIGRKQAEEDLDYKNRYYNNVYVYNSTKSGLEQIVIDVYNEKPLGMYSSSKRGAFLNSRYYYNNTNFRSTYGAKSPTPFAGYIHFKFKPSSEHLEELCKIINANKACGVTIYLFYPNHSVGYGNGGYGTFEYGT